MDDAGNSFDDVLERLRATRTEDASYAAGNILGSMCTAPHPVAVEAFDLFRETNLGDPGHFPGAASLEAEYLDMLLKLTHAPAGSKGLFLSGGTEANVVATAAALGAWRSAARTKQGQGDSVRPGDARRPNIVVGETAHFSFEKATKLADIEIRKAQVDDHFRLRAKDAMALIDADTCLLVGVAGNTEFGQVDALPDLAALARTRGIPFHVDAALGGFILPFVDASDGQARPTRWDFALPGVTSITMDPHKMGASHIPGGTLLVREASWLDHVSVDTPYVTTDKQASVLGTRPGAGAAAAWAVAKYLGRDGYNAQAARCLADAAWLRRCLYEASVPQHPTDLNVILARCDEPLAVQHELGERGWRVNAVPRFGGIRIVVMPHVTRAVLERALPDLIAVLERHHPHDATEGRDTPKDAKRAAREVDA